MHHANIRDAPQGKQDSTEGAYPHAGAKTPGIVNRNLVATLLALALYSTFLHAAWTAHDRGWETP